MTEQTRLDSEHTIVRKAHSEIVYGDCLDFLRTTEERFNLCITDPPFSSGQVHKTHGGRFDVSKSVIPFDDMSERVFGEWFKERAFALWNVMNAGGHVYMFTDWKALRRLMDLLELSSFKINGILVWDKGRIGCGRPWRSSIEFIIWASKSTARAGNRLDIPNIFRAKRSNKLYRKPMDLYHQILDVVAKEGDKVIDIFAGGRDLLDVCTMRGIDCTLLTLNPNVPERTKDAAQVDVIE